MEFKNEGGIVEISACECSNCWDFPVLIGEALIGPFKLLDVVGHVGELLRDFIFLCSHWNFTVGWKKYES